MSMTREEFVLGLVRALPEAFEDVDVHDEYDYSDTPPASWEHRGGENDGWQGVLACDHAVTWILGKVVHVDRRAKAAGVRPGREDALRRFFAFIEDALERSSRSGRNWLIVCLFEAQPWTEDVLEYLGSRTVEALREAQSRSGLVPPAGRWE